VRRPPGVVRAYERTRCRCSTPNWRLHPGRRRHPGSASLLRPYEQLGER
jgi:hypothetical protein